MTKPKFNNPFILAKKIPWVSTRIVPMMGAGALLRKHVLQMLQTRIPNDRLTGRAQDLDWVLRNVVLDYEERALVRYAIKEAQAQGATK